MGHQRAIGMITALFHRHVAAGALDHQNLRIAADGEGLVDIGFQRCVAPAARGLISRDHQLGLTAINPGGQGFGGKPCKNNRVDRTDTRAGQHGIGGLGDHGHIKHNPVAFGDAKRFVDICQLVHML